MPVQDRSGNKYEQLLASSLIYLGYELNGTTGKNYLHPSKRSSILIPGTYIQPDFVIREGAEIKAILYVTHWSNKRNSKFKFWRTWEECAQQKLALGGGLLTINCVFEALPNDLPAGLFITADDLPADPTRSRVLPQHLNGWDPGTGWAMIEAFDVSIVFPMGYKAVHAVTNFKSGEHDSITSKLLQKAVKRPVKKYYQSQWKILNRIASVNTQSLNSLSTTRSRYRIGLLHVYMLYRLFINNVGSFTPTLENFISALVDTESESLNINSLTRTDAFASFNQQTLFEVFEGISQIHVRIGSNPQTLCSVSRFTGRDASNSIRRVFFNNDLRLCLQDLRRHISEKGFLEIIKRTFARFDQAYGVSEALADLANPKLVAVKEEFVRRHFTKALTNEKELFKAIQQHAQNFSQERKSVSIHNQNWVFEMLLYLVGLNSTVDIQKRFQRNFEDTGHKLRPHAPWQDIGATVIYLLQGRNICEHWSQSSRVRTLNEEQFHTLTWRAVTKCILQGIQDRGFQLSPKEEIIKRYVENKSTRVISSELNGFHIMVEYYLSDLCSFTFIDDNEEETMVNPSSPSWQTEVVNKLWGGRPLETWMEGVSKNGEWYIKVQSAQDGNEGHKTKELAGRCRGIQLTWSHGENARDREQWVFIRRNTKKMALVLDGDWDVSKKRNLYEAGWEWVGDVSELGGLRRLINSKSNV